MTGQSHAMELRYTIDDDGVWIACTCRWEKCLGFWPSPSDVTQAAADHLREAYPKDRTEWGVMFGDGSVRSRWSGKTQRERAQEEWQRLQSLYWPDNIRLCRRADRNSPWEAVESE